MILLANGDSHTAGAEAVNDFAFSEDDPDYEYLGRKPHPDNLKVSWSFLLAEKLGAELVCDAESASSNTRIIRTTRDTLGTLDHSNVFVVIQWSTWEREEWFIDDQYYQVNASGIDIVPPEYQQRYKEFVISVDWTQKTLQAHDEIWAFHSELLAKDIPHLFFNGNSHFAAIHNTRGWGSSYIHPYDPRSSYDAFLRLEGHLPVSSHSWHFGPDGHKRWAEYLYKYITDRELLQNV
jgi:hypothetical protein